MSKRRSGDTTGHSSSEVLSTAAFVLDEEGSVIECLSDDPRTDQLGFDIDGIIGQSIIELLPESSKTDRLVETIGHALTTNAVQTVTYEANVSDQSRHFEGTIVPIPDDSASNVLWIARDITADTDHAVWFRRLNAIVFDSDRSFEAKLQAMFDLGCDRFGLDVGIVARIDCEADLFEVEYANTTTGQLTPGSELSFSETYCESLLANDRTAGVIDPIETGIDDRRAYEEFGIETYLGTSIPIDSDFDRTFIFVSTEPRSESFSESEQLFIELMGQWLQYELEHEIRKERERRIEAIFDQTYQFTGLLEPDGTLIEANKTALEFGGLERQDVVGKKMWELSWFDHTDETRERTKAAVKQAANDEFVRRELTIMGQNGEAVIDFSVRPVSDDDGNITLLVPEGRDITERKAHEDRLAALNEASRRLWAAESQDEIADIAVDIAQTILDEHLIGFWSYDAETDRLVPLSVTDAATLFDNSVTAPTEIGPIHAPSAEMEIFRRGEIDQIDDYQAIDNPAHPETPLGSLLAVPLGEYGQLHIGTETVTDFDDTLLEVLDVLAKNTQAALERQARDRELRRSRDRLARTEELATVGGWELDLRTEALTWTDGTHRIYEVADDFDPSLSDAIEFFHPEDRQRIREAINHSRETGDPYEVEARIITAQGRERWVEATGEVIQADGEPIRLEGAVRDITDRKEREQQLSVLYRILRHNLRNDLNVINGFSQSLGREIDRLELPSELADHEEDVIDRIATELSNPSADLERDLAALRETVELVSATPTKELQTYVEHIREASDKLMAIGDKANQLEELITEKSPKDHEIELTSTIETVVESVRGDYPAANIAVDRTDEAIVETDPETLTVILRELLDNAIEHTDTADRTVDIRTTRSGKGCVTVEIEDDGPGIPEYELEAIRQGKEEALTHGSGLGLWLVNWLTSYLDCELSFEASEAGGTVVRLALPVVDDVDGESHLHPITTGIGPRDTDSPLPSSGVDND